VKAPLIYIGATLRTARLTLEPLRPEHAQAMFEGFADQRIYTWIDVPPPASVDDLRDRFARIAQPYAPTGELWLNWPVRVDEAAEYAGLVEATMRPDRVVYLAYFVFTRFSRQGIAKEACTSVIDHLFRAYDAVEIRAEMDYRNIPSRCLVESLGFRRRTHNKQTTLRGRPALDYRYRLKRPPPEALRG
jgi:[ribosomal protein S5]-alanine N-acetyltransferase